MTSSYREITVTTTENFCVLDITDQIRETVNSSGVQEGVVAISSLHTTCAITVNENEERLLEDIRRFFLRLAPAEARYLHNDLHLRANIPPDEPENAHAHLIAMMLGNSEFLCLHGGELKLGRYQAVLFLEMDGPRKRTASVQVIGV